jgi:asparagine synthetase B (glutamine-hydrolysing)
MSRSTRNSDASLQPLCNLFAADVVDPEQRHRIASSMRGHGLEVAIHHGVVVGWQDLPGQPSSLITTASGGFARFSEGERSGQFVREHLVETALEHPRRVGHSQGDFGFVAVDAKRIAAVRSAVGLVPWMVMAKPGMTVLSTRVAWFERLLPEPPERDLFVHAHFTDGTTLPDHRSPWLGVRCVPPGSVWRVDRQTGTGVCPRYEEHQYWHPAQVAPQRQHSEAAKAEVVRAIRDVLVSHVDQDLADDGTNLVAVSGGVDSSILATVAHRAGKKFATVTLADPTSDEADSHNFPFVQRVFDAVSPLRSWVFRFDDEALAVGLPMPPATGCPVAHPILYVLSSLADETALTVYSGGELADDLFIGPIQMSSEWLADVGPLRFLSTIRKPAYRSVTWKGMVRLWGEEHLRTSKPSSRLRREFRPLSQMFSAALREESIEWSERASREASEVYGHWRFLNVAWMGDGWLLQNWETCSELGIRRSIPFLSREMIDLSCSLRPSAHAAPPKRLLRAAFSEQVDPTNLWRVDKGVSGNAKKSVPVGFVGLEHFLDRQWIHTHESASGEVNVSVTEAGTLTVLRTGVRPS